jgi:hypothetical protein
LYNASAGTVQLIADLTGYYVGGTPTAAGAFGVVSPSRALDTRSGVGAPKAAVKAKGVVAFKVAGVGGVPASGVSAVALTVTVTAPAAAGNVTAYGDGSARPGTSNLNFVRGQTVANLVIVPVGSDGKVALYNASAGTVQLIADLTGYYLAASPQPLPPSVAGISATSGSVVGGDVVTVTGAGFSGATSVLFGSAPAAAFTVQSPTAIQVTTPAALPGSVDVSVTTPNGTSAANTADQYTFVNPPDASSSNYVAATTTQTTSSSAVLSVTGGGTDWADPAAPTTTPWVVTLAAGVAHPAVGEQYYLAPGNPVFPSGLAGVVSAVQTGSDGTTALTVTPSSVDGVLGTATADYTGAIGNDTAAAAVPATGLKRMATQSAPSLTGTINFPKIDGPSGMFCKDKDGKSIDLQGSITLKLENVKAHAEIDTGGLFSKPFVDVWVQYEPTIGFNITAEASATCSVSRTWQTEHEKLFLLGDTGVTIAIAPDLSFSITASGTITVEQHSYRMMGFISNPDGSIRRIDAKSSDPVDVTASASLEADASVGVQIQVGLLDVIGVGMSLDAGIKGSIEYTPTPPQLCASVTPYFRGELYAYLNLWVKEWKLQAFSTELDLPVFNKCTASGDAPPTISSTTFPDGTVGVPYSAALTTADGRAGTWALSGGSLPTGLSIQGSSITGTPQSVGDSQAVVTFTDSNSHSATIVASISVSAGSGSGGGTTTTPTVATFDLPVGTVGVPLRSDALPSYDGTAAAPGTIYWALSGGSLPPGVTLNLDTSGGEVLYSFAGTPTQAGTWPFTLSATDSMGTKSLPEVFVVSGLPTASPYTVTSQNSSDRYGFTTTHDPDNEKTTITRTDSQTGAQVDVLAATQAPSLCTGGWPNYATLQSTSRDGNLVGISCSDTGYNGSDALYLLNITAGTATRVDVASTDYTGPVGQPSPYRDQGIPQNGISDDGSQVLIETRDLLTSDAAAETWVGAHLYVRDVSTATTRLVPDARAVGYDAFRGAAISGDGNYIDLYGVYCSAHDGNSCYNTRVGVIKSPDATTTSTLCASECSVVRSFDAGFGRLWSASADGLSVAVVTRADHYDSTGTWVAADDVYLFHATTNTTVDTGYIPLWSGNDGNNVGNVQVVLSPDGSKLFYMSDLREYTCQLNDVHVNGDGTLGASSVIGDPPQGLPRTGCSSPVAVSADSSRLLFDSSNSNLEPSPPLSDPNWPWPYYVAGV